MEKRLWSWETLRVGGEGDDRGRDGWMTSPAQWTWVWASSGRWWRTGKPGVLQSMGVAKSWTRLRGWTTTNSTRHSSWSYVTEQVTATGILVQEQENQCIELKMLSDIIRVGRNHRGFLPLLSTSSVHSQNLSRIVTDS